MTGFYDAVVLTDKLRTDFAAVADLLGPKRAFYAFAGELTKKYQDQPEVSEGEERLVRIIWALYDDYVETHA